MAKSSVSVWTRDIALTEEQHERLRQANPIHNQQHRGQEGRRAIRSRGTARGAGARAGGGAPRRSAAPRSAACSTGPRARGAATALCSTNSDVDDAPRSSCASSATAATSRDERITLRVNCLLNNGLSLDEIEAWWLARARACRAACLRAATVNRPSSCIAVAPQRLRLRHGGRAGATPPSSCRASTARSRSTGASSAPSGSD